jgi:hypothetical protein
MGSAERIAWNAVVAVLMFLVGTLSTTVYFQHRSVKELAQQSQERLESARALTNSLADCTTQMRERPQPPPAGEIQGPILIPEGPPTPAPKPRSEVFGQSRSRNTD